MDSTPSLKQILAENGIGGIPGYASPMLPDYLLRRVNELMAAREKEAPVDRAGWEARIAALREELRHSLGMPRLGERTPLNSKSLGQVWREGYSIEKILFEPLPGCVATAHLYLPEGAPAPRPAVLYTVGHWIENGKMEPDLQAGCIGLAKLGFVALIYDPQDQGERRADWHCHHHLEGMLVGCSQAGLTIWESVRALDYLQSRPEVDPDRLGVTGASGGGLNTMFLSAVDERVKASVPVCYVNAFEHLLSAMRDYNWNGGQDLCNQVPHILARADMGDICAVIAPRPLMIINATRDPMFPTEGATRAAARAEAAYRLLGVPDRVRLTLVEAGHGYDREMRQAAYGWFRRWLQGDGDGQPILEPALQVAPPRYRVHYITATADPDQPPPVADPQASPEMYCFAPDQPQSSWPAVTALFRQIAEPLPPVPAPPHSQAEWAPIREQLTRSLPKLLGPFPEKAPHTPRIMNQARKGNVFAERIVFESEPGIRIPAMFFLNEDWEGFQPAIIYVADQGKNAGLDDGAIESLLRLGFAVLAPDLRGTGESIATEFENASTAFMFDRDLFAQRLWDLWRAVDYVAEYSAIRMQVDKHRIACAGRGVAGFLALYVAALDPRIAAVGCLEAPVSYKAMLTEHAAYPASAYLFDVLNHLEVAHLAALTAPRPLFITDPLDGYAQPAPASLADDAYSWTQQVYAALQAPKCFHLDAYRWTHQVYAGLKSWEQLRSSAADEGPAVVRAAQWFLEMWDKPGQPA